MYQSPANWNLPFENVTVTTEDGTKINGWFVYHPVSRCGDTTPYTFLFFHGNAGNVGYRLENIRDMHTRLAANVFIIDYRGYGDSQDGPGPCQAGFLMDAMAAYRWLVEYARLPQSSKTKVSADRIILFGRSIGGAVACVLGERLLRRQVAGDESLPLPAGIVLENTFTSLKDIACSVFFFLRPFSWLMKPPMIFDEWKAAESLDCIAANYENFHCCLLSGAADTLVPPSHMRQLHAIVKKHKPTTIKFFIFPTGGHNDLPQKGGDEYWDSFNKFLSLVQIPGNGNGVS